MLIFKDKAVDLLSTIITDLGREELESLIEIPPSYDMGDYAFPTFRLAKVLRKAPDIIAQDLADKLKEDDNFEKIEAAGPYLNFFISREKLAQTTISEV
ncbi:MAG TPA: arginine--tRNA ligase, partial [Tissierellales bacterium]|nr:arginine--tRNA ligase [Tissierellales bacterium]